jgi:hypothetical protein
MNISMKWLKEYVDINCNIDEYCDAMTMSGTKVETYEVLGKEISGVVVGKILEIEKHPDADKLVVTKVDVGTEVIQIVTGATNISVNDFIPVALEGAKLAEGLKIKKGKVYAISGPSIAKEVASGHHTVLVLGGTKNKNGRRIEKLLETEKIHLTLSSDKDGIQLLGFYKNVIAILVGICEELGIGNNFKTALISKAYSQFYQINKNKIAKHTFVGPAGIGDLFVTAGSTQSRNHQFGKMLVKYTSIKEIKEKIGHIVEGYESMHKLKQSEYPNFDSNLINLMKKINRTKDKNKMEKLLLNYLLD